MEKKPIIILVCTLLCAAVAAGGVTFGIVQWKKQPPKKEPAFSKTFLEKNQAKEDYRRLHDLLESKKALCWLFAGDSITHGCSHTGYRRNFSQYFEAYIKTATVGSAARREDIVVNTGNSGATTADMRNNFEAWITSPKADVAFLGFGMNDCTAQGMTPELYRSNLLHAISALREQGTLPILQTPNTSNRQKSLLPYLQVVRDIAQEQSVLLVDNNQYWSDHKGSLKKMMSDAIHPNGAGHLTWARFLLRSLGMMKEESRLAALPYSALNEPLGENAADKEAVKNGNQALRELLSPYLSNETPVNWVFVGGESTRGNIEPLSERNYIQHFEEVARWELALKDQMLRSKAFINCGQSGGLSRFCAQYEERIGRFHPQVLSIMPEPEGEDLLSFGRQLSALIAKAKESGTVVFLQTPPAEEAVVQKVLEIGSQTNTLVLDHRESLARTQNPLDAQGRLSATGHLTIARDLCYALLEVPQNSRIH